MCGCERVCVKCVRVRVRAVHVVGESKSTGKGDVTYSAEKSRSPSVTSARYITSADLATPFTAAPSRLVRKKRRSTKPKCRGHESFICEILRSIVFVNWIQTNRSSWMLQACPAGALPAASAAFPRQTIRV